MTVNLSIKNVPDALAKKLRARAEGNHRSLQGELMALLESALGPAQTARDPGAHYVIDAVSPPAMSAPAVERSGERPTLRALLLKARAAGRDGGASSVLLLREARAERDEQLEKLLDAPDAYERARALLGAVGAGSRKKAKTPKAAGRTDKRG